MNPSHPKSDSRNDLFTHPNDPEQQTAKTFFIDLTFDVDQLIDQI